MVINLNNFNDSPDTLEEACQTIKQLIKLVKSQGNIITELEERLGLSSINSSKPPSTDTTQSRKKRTSTRNKNNSGRNRGGQPGHKGVTRTLIPTDKVDAVVACKPRDTCDCGSHVILEGDYRRHQVHELPEIRLHVTEYQLYRGDCAGCGKHYCGQLPEGVSWSHLGPKTHATIALLSTKYRQSKRLIQQLLEDLFQFKWSLGSVSNTEQRVSQYLAPAHEELVSAIPQQPVIHMDETSHYECYQLQWLWVAVASYFTCFVARASRGKRVASALLGNLCGGVLVSDRYASYGVMPAEKRQVCWAHLARDMERLAGRCGAAGYVGKQLLFYYGKTYQRWAQFKSGELSRRQLQVMTKPLQQQWEQQVESGIYCGHPPTERTCNNIFKLRAALWTLIEIEGVEPTNNVAERQLRPYVIFRKLSFGTQSERGSRFIERAFSAIMTCQQKGEDPLAFLGETVFEGFSYRRGPSLLTAPP